MSNEAERVVVELLAKVDGFDGKVKQSAAAFGGAMKQVETSADRGERAVGTAMAKTERHLQRGAQASRNLGFQIADINTQLAAGTSPFLVLAQQGPQVANALEGAKGKLGAFATFLGGPWGAALFGAVTILGVFGEKLFKTGESVDDLVKKLQEEAKKAADADKANKLFGETLEGVTKALKDNQDALDKLKGAQNTGAEAALHLAEAEARKAERIIASTIALLEQAKAQEELNRSIRAADPLSPDSAAQAQAQNSQRQLDLEDKITKAKQQQAKAQSQINEAQSQISVERGARSIEDQITRAYDRRIEAARMLALQQGKVGTELTKQVKALREARDLDIKRFRDAEAERNKRTSNAESGREVTGAEAASIARAAGLQVNSSTRSFAQQKALYDRWVAQGRPADNPVAMPGSSAHEGAKGRWALDIQFGQGVTPALLRKVFADQGINLTKVFKERGHFHVEGSRSQADAADAAIQQAAEKELVRRQTFENELATLQGSELDARQALVASAEEIAKLEVEAIEISRKKYDDNLNSLVEQDKLHKDEADQLRGINDERAKLRTELVQRREDQRKFRMAEAAAQEKLSFASDSNAVQEELLRSQEGIAKTAKQRHDLEQRLIDLTFDEEKLQLQAVIAKADRLAIEAERLRTLRALSDEEKQELKKALAQAQIAQQRLDTQPERKTHAQTGNDRQNANPLAKMLSEIPDTADEINEAFEGIAAGGLQSLADGIADAIVNFRSLGDVARSVLQTITAEVIKLVIKMLVLKAVKAVLGLAGGGSVGGLGHESGHARGGRIGFAPGGLISGPGTSTSDSIRAITTSGRPILLSDQEYIIRGAAVRKLGVATLDQINATGRLPVGYAGGGMVRTIRPINAPAAMWGAERGGIDEASLRRIEGAVERGAAAQAPVNLYPTLSPKRAMEQMLSDPGAQRVLFGFMSDNSGKINGNLRR